MKYFILHTIYQRAEHNIKDFERNYTIIYLIGINYIALTMPITELCYRISLNESRNKQLSAFLGAEVILVCKEQFPVPNLTR